MKTTTTKKTPRKSTREPRHQAAIVRLERILHRAQKLSARFSRYGHALTDPLAVATSSLEEAIRFLQSLAADYAPPTKNGEAKEEAPKKSKKAKADVDVEGMKKALGTLIADAAAQKSAPAKKAAAAKKGDR